MVQSTQSAQWFSCCPRADQLNCIFIGVDVIKSGWENEYAFAKYDTISFSLLSFVPQCNILSWKDGGLEVLRLVLKPWVVNEETCNFNSGAQFKCAVICVSNSDIRLRDLLIGSQELVDIVHETVDIEPSDAKQS